MCDYIDIGILLSWNKRKGTIVHLCVSDLLLCNKINKLTNIKSELINVLKITMYNSASVLKKDK